MRNSSKFNDQYIILAVSSFLFCIGTFIGGYIIQLKIEKKIIPSMITYIPYIIFMTFYIIACCAHLISSLYGFFRTKWFLSLTIFLRLISIVVGLFAIYLNYSKKDNLIFKIEQVWFQNSFELIVSYYQDYFGCCGWNTTTATCSYTRCYDFVNNQIDEIARLIGITVFIINTFQVGLCVDSILAIALHIESGQRKDTSKQQNKNNQVNNNDKNSLNSASINEPNKEQSASNDNNQDQQINQKDKEKKLTFEHQNEDENQNNNNDQINISDNSSNTLNTTNVLHETSINRNLHKNKKPKESQKKKANQQENEELIKSHDYT